MKAVSKLEFERTAVHEAGHAIVSVYLGVAFDYVEIVTDGTGGVYLPIEPEIKDSKLESFAQKQVIVAYAGRISQRLFLPDQPEYEIVQCSKDDNQKIEAIAEDFPSVEIGES